MVGVEQEELLAKVKVFGRDPKTATPIFEKQVRISIMV